MLLEILDLGQQGWPRTVWRLADQFQASDIIASIGSWRSPQQNTSGEQLPWCNAREIERNHKLWFLRRVIGKAECSSHDMGTGEHLAFAHEEARANDLSTGGEDTYK